MQNQNLLEKISAVLFLYNEPISLLKIREFLNNENSNVNSDENNISLNDIESIFLELENKLSEIGLAIIKNENKNTEKTEYSLAVKSELSEIAKKIRQDELEGDLTPASLQVLTICAYLGSPTKNEVSFIRGVQSTQSIRSLSVRGLLKRNGERYSLSTEAMQMLGINKIEDLPEYEKIKTDFIQRLDDILNTEKELAKDKNEDKNEKENIQENIQKSIEDEDRSE